MTKRNIEDIRHLPGFMIRRLNQINMGIFAEETTGYDLTPAQYGALSLIASMPGMDQTKLMEATGLDRSSVTKCVERLEARELITRRIDSADRRQRHLFPTEAGHALLLAVDGDVARSQARLLEPLGPEKARQFLSLLDELLESQNHLSRVPLKQKDE